MKIVRELHTIWEGVLQTLKVSRWLCLPLISMIFVLIVSGCNPSTENGPDGGSDLPTPPISISQTAPKPTSTLKRPRTSDENPLNKDRLLPPLYLTIVVHNEEDMQDGTQPKDQIPDYDGDEKLMLHFTKAMRAFAAMAQQHGAKINFGSDWTFSKGVANFDPTFYSDLEGMGHEIDAHAHESFVLYHEVRDFINQAGGHPTHVASGMNEVSIQRQMEYFDQYYPEFQILWGVSLPGHGAGECIATWVWRPSREDWTEHDPDGNYLYIGHGELMNSLDLIQEAISNRSRDRVNTYALFATPRDFKAAYGTEGIDPNWMTDPESHNYWENRVQWWDDFLSEVDVWVQGGEVEYASLTDIAGYFQAVESRLDLDFDDCPRSEESMTDRTREAGYYR